MFAWLQFVAQGGVFRGMEECPVALREEMTSAGNWLFCWRSYLPMLLVGPVLLALTEFRSGGDDRFYQTWEWICLGVSILGLFVRAATSGFAGPGTSGGNTKRQVAERLNTLGMYSVVRHPLYVGNYLIWLGVSLVLFVWWLPVFFTLVFWIYYERIMFAEEDFLRQRFGSQFEQWATRTPAFLPRLANWRTPDKSFSMRWVLRREYSGFFALILAHTAMNLAKQYWVNGRWGLDMPWLVLISASFLVYAAVRTLRHRTNVLHVENWP